MSNFPKGYLKLPTACNQLYVEKIKTYRLLATAALKRQSTAAMGNTNLEA